MNGAVSREMSNTMVSSSKLEETDDGLFHHAHKCFSKLMESIQQCYLSYVDCINYLYLVYFCDAFPTYWVCLAFIVQATQSCIAEETPVSYIWQNIWMQPCGKWRCRANKSTDIMNKYTFRHSACINYNNWWYHMCYRSLFMHLMPLIVPCSCISLYLTSSAWW